MRASFESASSSAKCSLCIGRSSTVFPVKIVLVGIQFMQKQIKYFASTLQISLCSLVFSTSVAPKAARHLRQRRTQYCLSPHRLKLTANMAVPRWRGRGWNVSERREDTLQWLVEEPHHFPLTIRRAKLAQIQAFR